MTDEKKPQPTVIPFEKRARDCMQTVRDLAQDSQNVALGRHARDRMEERGITNMEVIKALRFGDILGEPVPGDNPGEVKVKVVRYHGGGRTMGVVTLIVKNGTRLFVKTVEWEDVK